MARYRGKAGLSLTVVTVGLMVLAAVGCGGGKTDAKGKVTYQGKTVVWGSVTLVDSTGQYHQGPIDLEGNYTIANVPAGKVKIAVTSPDPYAGAGRPKPSGTFGGKGQDGDDPRLKFKREPVAEQPKPAPGKWFPLPDKVNDPTNSGLTGELSRGKALDIAIP